MYLTQSPQHSPSDPRQGAWAGPQRGQSRLLGVALARAVSGLAIAAALVSPGCSGRGEMETALTTDSVEQTGSGQGLLTPVAHIAHERIDECSGIVWLDGAFFAHNDSGDDPVLYRSTTPDFAEAQVLPLPGAAAIDWEDITILDGDLIIGDIGDNRRERESLTLYRARYVAADDGEPGELRLIATYPFKYPDAAHDAEALAVIDGTLHLISKARGEKTTNVYAFDSLRRASELDPGGVNLPRLVASLDIGEGEQVTAADYDAESRTLVLLTYTHILRYPREQIGGKAAESTLIAARQCESLCFRGDQVIFTNEQRDVFTINEFIRRPFESLLPERGNAMLPWRPVRDHPGETAAFRQDDARELTLGNSRKGEQLSWYLSGEDLLIQGRLHYSGEFQPTLCHRPGDTDTDQERGPRLGSCLLLVFSREARLLVSGDELQLAIGSDSGGTPGAWQLDLTGKTMELEPFQKGEISGQVRDGVFQFELALPASAALGDSLPEQFLFDAHGLRLHGEKEVRFSGVDVNTVRRPYLWGNVTIVR